MLKGQNLNGRQMVFLVSNTACENLTVKVFIKQGSQSSPGPDQEKVKGLQSDFRSGLFCECLSPIELVVLPWFHHLTIFKTFFKLPPMVK
jgi:hypothetical protein